MKHSPVTNKPYINDAVIGNGSMTATLGTSGELYRLWWPHADLPQHVESMKTGIYIERLTPETLWLDDAEVWTYEQTYLPGTNILKTAASSSQVPIKVQATDFITPDKDLLIRHYELTNTGAKQRKVRLFVYASLTIAESRRYNTTTFEPRCDGLIFFRHQYVFALSSPISCAGYAINTALEHATAGDLPGDTIAMLPHGALAYHFDIPAGETVSLAIYLTAGHSIRETLAQMSEARDTPVEEWLAQTIAYWENYLMRAKPLPTTNAKVQAIYERSLLVCKLMADKSAGSVIAAPELDEAYTRCGGYAYCWGRDAAFIATAFDRAGLHELSRNFYRWCLLAQEQDGSWQQRHYHDGRLAPSWGLQIDEGGSILWGMHQHFLATNDCSFLTEVWGAVEKGVEFLLSYLDEETGLPLPSRDLWEERVGEHTYSAAAVYGGLCGASSIAGALGKADLAKRWQNAAVRLREAIVQQAWNPKTNRFYRSLKRQVSKSEYQAAVTKGVDAACETDEKGYVSYFLPCDEVLDISLVGLSVPFGVICADDPRMVATADAIERACTSPLVGGILRYEDDRYIGGNPWILTTLWLAQFRIRQGRLRDAKKLFDWAVDHATSLQLLPEQVDKETGEAAWVVPLTWSHAMFVLTAHMLAEAGQL